MPIIVVTAREDEFDRVRLLEIGADDYVVKPFGFRELVARIRAVQRRVGGRAPDQLAVQRLGPLEIDRGARRVRLRGDEIELTPKEFDLLAFLAEAPGAVRTREEIMATVVFLTLVRALTGRGGRPQRAAVPTRRSDRSPAHVPSARATSAL